MQKVWNLKIIISREINSTDINKDDSPYNKKLWVYTISYCKLELDLQPFVPKDTMYRYYLE